MLHIRLPPDDEYLVYLKHVEDIVKNKTQKSASLWFYYIMFPYTSSMKGKFFKISEPLGVQCQQNLSKFHTLNYNQIHKYGRYG